LDAKRKSNIQVAPSDPFLGGRPHEASPDPGFGEI